MGSDSDHDQYVYANPIAHPNPDTKPNQHININHDPDQHNPNQHAMKISIIVPAHNEEKRLPVSIPQIVEYMSEVECITDADCIWDLLLVENGSTDNTLKICWQLSRDYQHVHAISISQRGKGAAVREGMLCVDGDVRYMCDADLSSPISELPNFVAAIQAGADVAIGTREGDGAIVWGEPIRRRLTGRVFNLLVRALVMSGFRDTQCGFKMFTAQAAEVIFPQLTTTGMAFDVEVLRLARQVGYNISQVPVFWAYDGDSRVRLLHDSVTMFTDVLRVARASNGYNRSAAASRSSSVG